MQQVNRAISEAGSEGPARPNEGADPGNAATPSTLEGDPGAWAPLTLLIGGVAGLLATAPMTVAMNLLFRGLPRHERYPLPPARVTTHLAQRLGMQRAVDRPERHAALTTLTHYGFGTAMGALYAPLGEGLPAPPVVKGVLWGLLVWLGNYLGLLPALGLLPRATQNPRWRDLLMITAHVIWGAVVGVLANLLARRLARRD